MVGQQDPELKEPRSGSEKQSMGDDSTLVTNMLLDKHRLMLEALRTREQDIIRYLVILGPALAGFTWLIRYFNEVGEISFAIGTGGIIFILFIGGWYSIALGYNYRYIQFHLMKLEKPLKRGLYMPSSWPKDKDDFKKRYGKLCLPPEIIKVFWFSFVFLIGGITVAAYCISGKPYRTFLVCFGLWTLIMSILMPICYGCKIVKIDNPKPGRKIKMGNISEPA